jgi:hypothetical protein
MTLDRSSLLLNMLLVLVSVSAHQAGADEFAFILATAAVCVFVWRREKIGRPLRLSDATATIICLLAFIVLMWRGISASTSGGFRIADIGIPSVGDFLIVFQWVTLCREQKGHDLFWMYMVTLVHMGTAGLQMPGVEYGGFFLAYAFLAVCALAARHARQEARAAGAGRGAAAEAARIAGTPRINRRFYLGALAALPPVLIVVVMLFILLPRTAATTTLAPIILRMGQQPTSGFSPTVQLGAIGQIQDNPTPVMHVVVRDPKTGESVQFSPLLLRGLPLDAYIHEGDAWYWHLTPSRGSQWFYWRSIVESPRLGYIYDESFPGYDEAPCREITCDIQLEPLDQRYLFVPFAPESISSNRPFSVRANARSHVLETVGIYRRTPINYTVTSRLFDPAPPPKLPTRTVPEKYLRQYLALPDDLSPRIAALARQIAPASVPTDYQKAERILEYLSDSRRFSYTTEMRPTPGVEPVEDFLFNLRRGHCEYFAASMAVLLREVNVPARLVNGFKAVEWNSLAGAYVVRQQHAHSWVEAYLRPYGWRTLDPTAVSRDAATPKAMFAQRFGRNVYDWTESLWVSNVLNFDATSQAGVYGALQGFAGFLRRWTTAPFERIGIGGSWGIYEPPGMSGALYVIFAAVLWIAAALLAAGLAWSVARRFFAQRAGRRRPMPGQFRYYARMERLLARRGFRRAETQTPWEFSRALLERGWPAAPQVAAITGRFCSARYGAHPPTDADLREIEQALQAIRRAR